MADSATIRPLDPSHSDQVTETVSMINLCYRGDRNWTNEHHIVRGARITADELRQKMERVAMFVAVIGSDAERIIGCITMNLRSVTGPVSPSSGYAGIFAVHPDYGGKGLGSRLMLHAEDFCLGKGASEMVLDTLDCRESILAWYGRRGYVTQHATKRPAHELFSRNERFELLVEGVSFVRMEKKLRESEALTTRSVPVISPSDNVRATTLSDCV